MLDVIFLSQATQYVYFLNQEWPTITTIPITDTITPNGENYKERRKLALEKKEKNKSEKSDRVIAPIDFNPAQPKISEVFTKPYRAMILKKKSPHNSSKAAPKYEKNSV